MGVVSRLSVLYQKKRLTTNTTANRCDELIHQHPLLRPLKDLTDADGFTFLIIIHFYLACRCRCLFDLPVGPHLNVFLFVAFFQLRASVLCLPAYYFDFLYPGRSVSNS